MTLKDDPDFEKQSSYHFTVVASDAAGNSSEQAVSLAINDVDETAPTVSSIALTSAVGAQNDTLNAGDTVSATVTMSENVVVDTSGGTPTIDLDIGGTTVQASYVSGSGTASLVFSYTIEAGENDSDGIGISRNGLELNGGALTDAAGNVADVHNGEVPSNPAFAVDTTAPALSPSSSTPADGATDVAIGQNIVLTFSEDAAIGSGNIVITDGTDTRTIDVRDSSQVSVSGNDVTVDPSANLNPSSEYHVELDSGALTDQAGNAFPGISDSTTLNFTTADQDTSVVVFDLVQGSSSDHSGRTFDSDTSYEIYIRVNSQDAGLSTAGDGPGTWQTWAGADNLGSDDRVILVGDGAPVEGFLQVERVVAHDAAIAWQTHYGFTAVGLQNETLHRATGGGADNVALFDSALPAAFVDGQGGQLNTMYLTNMPAGVLTSQGLV